MHPVGIEHMSLLVASCGPNHYTINLHKKRFFLTTSILSYLIKSWDDSQAEPRAIPRLNLGNIPAIAGKTNLVQIPGIAGGKPCYSRDLSWEYISLL